jgi:hypothetical protein
LKSGTPWAAAGTQKTKRTIGCVSQRFRHGEEAGGRRLRLNFLTPITPSPTGPFHCLLAKQLQAKSFFFQPACSAC